MEKWRDPPSTPFSDPELGPTVMAKPGKYGMPQKCRCSGTTCPVSGHRCWKNYGAHAPFLDTKHYWGKTGPQLDRVIRPFGAQFFVSVRVQLANDERDGVREREYCRNYLEIVARYGMLPQCGAPGWAWGLNHEHPVGYGI